MENELFEKAPVSKAYFSLALPVVFSMVITLVYNMVDTYFIARTGITDLIAGVSLGAPVFTFMIALGDIFGLGGSSVISRLFGQKKDEDGKRISAFCFYASLLLGLIVAVVMLVLRTPILRMLGADESTWQYASQYYTFIVLGAPFIIFSYTPNNLLRTEGFAKASMIGTVSGSIINIILDPIFISVLGLGAAGAAIATVLGNICADLFFIWFLLNKSKKLSASIRLCRISKKEFGDVMAIGLPASITNFMQSLGTTLTNRFLLAYGTSAIAAMGIAMKVNMIAVLILVGFSFGAQPLIGYNYGAKNRERLKNVLKFCYGFESLLAIAMAAILALLARYMVTFFVSDPILIDTAVPMLRWQLAGMCFVAIVQVSTCIFQSCGKAAGAFILSVSRQGIIFAIVIALASMILGYQGVLMAQAISDLLTAILAILLVRTYLGEDLGLKKPALQQAS
jgi:putative MATE family efflux protein